MTLFSTTFGQVLNGGSHLGTLFDIQKGKIGGLQKFVVPIIFWQSICQAAYLAGKLTPQATLISAVATLVLGGIMSQCASAKTTKNVYAASQVTNFAMGAFALTRGNYAFGVTAVATSMYALGTLYPV